MRLPLAVGVLLCSFRALAQVSVVESATRAELVDGHTTISLAVNNRSKQALDVRIGLRWLSPDDKVDAQIWRDASLKPGESAVSIALPLTEKCDALVERLEYEINPSQRNYTALTPIKGRLSFPAIADYAFTFGVLTAGIPRPNQPFELRVLTAHPLTGRPVPGVTVEAEDATAVTGQDGIAVLRVEREADDEGSIDVTARIGDFNSTGGSVPLPNAEDTIRGYTDKPIYQPGQTMHVRILAVAGSGKVKAGQEYEIRIMDKSPDLVYGAKVKTSRFGIASTDWEIPEDQDSGRYTIQLKTDETDQYILRAVDVRKYELPSFRVTATPDHPFYLPGQNAQVEVSGEYLFGKPVPAGEVRITAADDDKKILAEGTLDAEGRFRATLDMKIESDENTRFEDVHLIVFLNDPSTNRTEQRQFDIRVSHDPVHVYAPRWDNTGAGRRLYVTTYSPDGSPLVADVEVANGATVLGRGKTNRFGVARIDLAAAKADDRDNGLEIHAVTASGLRGQTWPFMNDWQPGIWLRTDRTLYRAGEAVKCTVGSTERDRQVLLLASNEKDQVVFSKSLSLKEGQGEIVIPYDKRFGRVLSIGVASGTDPEPASRQVYFPGPSNLVVKAAPAQTPAPARRNGQHSVPGFHPSRLGDRGCRPKRAGASGHRQHVRPTPLVRGRLRAGAKPRRNHATRPVEPRPGQDRQ
jgi:hypothetical protein